MINALLRILVQLLLSLRYRIRVRGLDEIARRGTNGILFLPNHPAFIDPIIVLAALHRTFAPRALADEHQIDRRFIRWLARRVGVRPLPDVRVEGAAARGRIEATMRQCIEGLRRGENLLLYPSGHVYRSRFEDLRGNSGVETVLREAPDVRVVVVRTRGLWGSSFSLAGGHVPSVARILKRAPWILVQNLLVFTPRREVTLELLEPPDLPRTGDRHELNAFLERCYNADAPPNTYVPYTIWERGGTRALPDAPLERMHGSLTRVPATTRRLVTTHLRELTGREPLRDDERLAQDLGLDSLARAELLLWLNHEFGLTVDDVDALQTVGDVLLAARGEAAVARAVEIRPPPAAWLCDLGDRRVTVPPGGTVTEVFLARARQDPKRLVIADQLRGTRSYRDLVTAILALRPRIAKLSGDRIGIMLPASVGADVVYLATLFSGKVPVMINWTTGPRNTVHALETVGARHVLTAGGLVARIEAQGNDLSGLKPRLVLVEALAEGISSAARFGAWLRARLSWSPLDRARVPEMAAILLTSGSETLPKAVPLTHLNVLTNLRDVLASFTVRENDRMIGFLPPFHSFGLTVTMLAPLLAGIRTVYHPNPTEAWVLARLIQAYRVSLLVGTPTFLSGIVRAAAGHELASLRLAVTGAERCPEQTYRALADRCPQAVVLEGYGVTECSPIISVNREEHPHPGTIGQVLPSLEYALVDPETGEPAAPGAPGMLLVRGPSVFGGYLGGDVASPFVEHAGQMWYRTGDLVSADERGVLTFRGRLKRFVKLGGEMISLPAIEAVLEQHHGADADEGPVVAVTATPSEDHPELVLFTTRAVDRQTVNQQIRSAGLSALHNIARVIRVEQIPVLGTGKTDYRALQARLSAE